MNRERGVSSLAMVLLLLVLGSLLLQGVSRQEASFAARVVTQSQALQRQAVVQSAMEWGVRSPGAYNPPYSVGAFPRRMPRFACVCLPIILCCLLPTMKRYRYGVRGRLLMAT